MASLIHFIILVTRQLFRTDSIIGWSWPWCQQCSSQLRPRFQAVLGVAGWAVSPTCFPHCGPSGDYRVSCLPLLSPKTNPGLVLTFPHSASSQHSPLLSQQNEQKQSSPWVIGPHHLLSPLLLLAAGNTPDIPGFAPPLLYN